VERVGSILQAGQTVELPMLSGSMLPLLPPQSVITITSVDWDNSRIGDIVVFPRGDGLVAHRLLLAWKPGTWGFCYQKGDNSRRGEWIRAGRIVGRVIRVRYEDGEVHDLDTPAVRQNAYRIAGESLREDCLERWLLWPRRIKSWLYKTNENSASR